MTLAVKVALNLITTSQSVGSIAGLRTAEVAGSFRELRIVIATGFIPLSPLSVVSTMVKWESNQWLGKNIVRSTSEKNSMKAWIGAPAAAI